MPLPDDPNSCWPPKAWAPLQQDAEEASAWYSGDKTALAALYAAGTPRSTDGRFRFWARRSNGPDNQQRQRLHVPAAADVASTSADLLFGDPPSLTITEAHESGAATDAKAAEDRLAELVEIDGIASTLLEAAEVAAAIGGIYLRPVVDPAIAPHPILTIIHGDRAVPEFRWGRLVAVTFWREVLNDNTGQVWRHLERHEPGVILHGLYAGTKEYLGTRRPLQNHESTRALLGDAGPNEEGELHLSATVAAQGLDVRYVPNALNRKHRGQPAGRADIAGTEDLLDALDETWSSWMRDIRLGKGRIIVPDEFLERKGRGQGASFDLDQEVFSPLAMDPSSQDKAGITVSQFAIRTADHAQTAKELFDRIVTTAGYAPQSFGGQGDGGMQTATEVDAREGRSARTVSRKQRQWKRAIEDIGLLLLILDQEQFGSGVTPMRPTLAYPDAAEADMREVASTLNLLKLAEAVSTETRVKMLNPEWGDEQITAEVSRIQAESGTAVPDPTGIGLL